MEKNVLKIPKMSTFNLCYIINVFTGDVAYYDEDNHIYIIDRIKDIFKVDGFQVCFACCHSVTLAYFCIDELILHC